MIITALIGFPTNHSVSPVLFSIYAKEFGIEYSHLKIDIPGRNLKKALDAIKTLNIKGLNITIPHKTDIIQYLDHVDNEALKIGAVNTVVNKENKLHGYNTDLYGAITSIKDHIPELSSQKVVILGTGGAAKALITGFIENNASVSVIYRTPKSKRTKSTIRHFNNGVNYYNYQEKIISDIVSKSDIICNTTDCGMVPNDKESPLSQKILKRASSNSDFSKKLFYDAVFNPYETLFLKEARKLGSKIQGGTEMMIYQGVKAFELWTRLKVGRKSVAEAKKVLRKHLLKNEK